ncbi:splicing factor 3B subunit 5/RDS3 complex subunit 10, partial [Yarrowia lipolytica]
QADKLREQQLFQLSQSRYLGVGNPDTTKQEWQTNVARDSYASYIGHPGVLSHMSLALGQTEAETRIQFLDKLAKVGTQPKHENGDR